MEDGQAGYLQEYRELRAEIRQHFEWRGKSLHFAVLLTAASVALSPRIGSSAMFLLTALTIAFLWYDEVRHLVAVFRLATYLEVFVEPQVTGLNAETIARRHPIHTSVIERIIANGAFPAMFGVQVVLLFERHDWEPWQYTVVAVGLAVVFLGLVIHSVSVARTGRAREYDAWRTLAPEGKVGRLDA